LPFGTRRSQTLLRLELQIAAQALEAGTPAVALVAVTAVVVELDLLVQIDLLAAADAAPLRAAVVRNPPALSACRPPASCSATARGHRVQ
jgi:hypothetical protein